MRIGRHPLSLVACRTRQVRLHLGLNRAPMLHKLSNWLAGRTAVATQEGPTTSSPTPRTSSRPAQALACRRFLFDGAAVEVD